MRRMLVGTMIAAAVATFAVGGGGSLASAASGGSGAKVTICHATASASNPYVTTTVDASSILGDAGHGQSGVNAGDIIPPFSVGEITYPGNNWDPAHAAVLNNGCGADTTTTFPTQ